MAIIELDIGDADYDRVIAALCYDPISDELPTEDEAVQALMRFIEGKVSFHAIDSHERSFSFTPPAVAARRPGQEWNNLKPFKEKVPEEPQPPIHPEELIPVDPDAPKGSGTKP